MSLMFAAMATSGTNEIREKPKREPLSNKEKEAIKARQNTKRGLKEFKYGSKTVWAINEKVADKKAKKKGYIQ